MLIRNIFIYVSLLCLIKLVKSNVELYIDSNSYCESGCGSRLNPFQNIKSAIDEIEYLFKGESHPIISPIIYIHPGIYVGELNTAIKITRDLSIISLSSAKYTIFDCENAGYGFKVENSLSFFMKGVTIQNCNSVQGGAISLYKSISTIEDSKFINNKAGQGGALYIDSYTTNIVNCSFKYNTANENGQSIFLKDYSLLIEDKSSWDCNGVANEKDIFCDKPESSTLCGKTSTCSCTLNNCTDVSSDTSSICDDNNNCDYNCPLNCQDQFSGWILEEYHECILDVPSYSNQFKPSNCENPSVSRYSEFPNFKNKMISKACPISGILYSHINVDTKSIYRFKVSSKNLGVMVVINSQIIIDFYFISDINESERSIVLNPNQSHNIKIFFFAVTSADVNLKLEWMDTSNGYKNLFQPISSSIHKPASNSTCGNGICDETPTDCLQDCHNYIEVQCAGQSPPNPLENRYSKSDLVGSLLNNQYIYSLPGISYFSHGLDLITGVEQAAPLFSFDYCDNSSFTVIQDSFRRLMYSIPYGLSAQLSSKCDYDQQTTSYTSSSEMASDMSEQKGISAELSASGGGFFTKVAVSASMSLNEDVQKAGTMESTNDGSVSVTEINCEVSKVHVVSPKFHPKFIEDLSKATDNDKMENLIEKYGSIYMKSGTLGGQLKQITLVSHSVLDSQTSQSIEKQVEVGVSISVKSKVMSGGVGFQGSLDSTVGQEQQESFESNSERSSLIIKGGAPGSYGNDEDDPFYSWASAIDLNPYPISHEIGFIGDIIPSHWKSNSFNYKTQWKEAEYRLYFKAIKGNYYLQNITAVDLASNKYLLYFEVVKTFTYTGNIICNITFEDLTTSTVTIPKDSKDYVAILPSNKVQKWNISSGDQQLFIIYDITTSRVWNQLFLSNTQSENQLLLYFNSLSSSPTKLYLYLTLLSDTQSITLPRFDPSVGNYTIPNQYGYLGKILGVSMRLVSSLPTTESTSNQLSFNRLVVHQTCPLNDHSKKCVDKSYTGTSLYTRSFETRKNYSIGLNKPVFVKLKPVG